jgi:hypothetical protein
VGSEVSAMLCQSIGLMQVVGAEGSVVVSVAWTETLCDRRNSNRHDSETQNTQISKVGRRKMKESALLH